MNNLRRDTSHKALAAGLSALLAIGKNSVMNENYNEKILSFAKEVSCPINRKVILNL